jgi:hypothetical protein
MNIGSVILMPNALQIKGYSHFHVRRLAYRFTTVARNNCTEVLIGSPEPLISAGRTDIDGCVHSFDIAVPGYDQITKISSMYVINWDQRKVIEIKLRHMCDFYSCDVDYYTDLALVMFITNGHKDVYLICLKTYKIKIYLRMDSFTRPFVLNKQLMAISTYSRDNNGVIQYNDEGKYKTEAIVVGCDVEEVLTVSKNSVTVRTASKEVVNINFEEMFGQRAFRWSVSGPIPPTLSTCCFTKSGTCACLLSFHEADLDSQCCWRCPPPCPHGRSLTTD